MLHVGRDREGRRRLAEIAVLQRGVDGVLDVRTAWHADAGLATGAGILHRMITERGVA
ncbi:conjugal transfer protein TrbB [Mycobacterium dioxanotrophicus]|uniref:Conjugal transfer protein TrbB n=1 Tax=Mycobacterium dioxanotrophicus TaxID=482462 RepID=A0A1Y0BY56_9MYCO|nr:conjugal transfer protein TrbB [Mycobacterium dioxanotrophicus]